MAAQISRGLQAYRVILRTIRTVFDDDSRMQKMGSQQARLYFEKYRTITDPKRIDYLLKEAYEARDAMYRDVMKLDYSAEKGRHVGVIEKRHLKFEDGTAVYQAPASGRGLGTRNENPISSSTPKGLKLTTTTTTKPNVDQV